MLAIILDSLVPVFFGMALGYVGGWTRDVDNKHVAELNALVMDFAVPASMFVTVVQASRRTLLDQLPLAANLSISMLILYFVTYAMVRRGFGANPGRPPYRPSPRRCLRVCRVAAHLCLARRRPSGRGSGRDCLRLHRGLTDNPGDPRAQLAETRQARLRVVAREHPQEPHRARTVGGGRVRTDGY
jgi:Membrane transport protein